MVSGCDEVVSARFLVLLAEDETEKAVLTAGAGILERQLVDEGAEGATLPDPSGRAVTHEDEIVGPRLRFPEERLLQRLLEYEEALWIYRQTDRGEHPIPLSPPLELIS